MHWHDSRAIVVAIFAAINFMLGVGIGIKLYNSTSGTSSVSEQIDIGSIFSSNNKTEEQDR